MLSFFPWNTALSHLFLQRTGIIPKPLEALREALRYAVLFDTYEKNAEKTSLLVRGLKACGVSKSSPDDTWWAVRRLSEEMAEGEFDSVRGESEFAVLEAEISDYLRKIINRKVRVSRTFSILAVIFSTERRRHCLFLVLFSEKSLRLHKTVTLQKYNIVTKEKQYA